MVMPSTNFGLQFCSFDFHNAFFFHAVPGSLRRLFTIPACVCVCTVDSVAFFSPQFYAKSYFRTLLDDNNVVFVYVTYKFMKHGMMCVHTTHFCNDSLFCALSYNNNNNNTLYLSPDVFVVLVCGSLNSGYVKILHIYTLCILYL